MRMDKKVNLFRMIFLIAPLSVLIFIFMQFYNGLIKGTNIYLHSYISTEQTINCNSEECYIHYYGNNSVDCNIKTSIRSEEIFKSSRTKVYYDKKGNCSLYLIEAEDGTAFFGGNNIGVISVFAMFGFFILMASVIIRQFLDSLREYRMIDYFEKNEPEVYKDIPFRSVKNVAQEGEYTHKVKVEINLPSNGLTTFKQKVKTSNHIIESVDVYVDPNDISKYYIVDSKDRGRNYRRTNENDL